MCTIICSAVFGYERRRCSAECYFGGNRSRFVSSFYNKIFAVTFDETFAQATGVKANLYNTLIAVLTAVTIVLGMRMMGALLISSLIIFPALTSMRVCRTFRSVIINSAVISVLCLVIGIAISYVWATPAGASVVIVNAAALAVYSIVGMIRCRK